MTDEGRAVALEMIRHHRLIEAFLVETLGVPWDRVHDEAERWEHVLSEYMEEKIDALLGYPKFDPHGAPIPSPELEIESRYTFCLYDLDASLATLEVCEVLDDDPAMLRYIGERGLYPGVSISMQNKEPFEGPITVLVHAQGEQQCVLGKKVAQQIFVRPNNEANNEK